MDKLKLILQVIQAGTAGLLPPGWQPIANLVGNGIEEIFTQIDREREMKGLSWQELEEQLGVELVSEKQEWDKFLEKLKT